MRMASFAGRISRDSKAHPETSDSASNRWVRAAVSRVTRIPDSNLGLETK
jgi:hypothetical protein